MRRPVPSRAMPFAAPGFSVVRTLIVAAFVVALAALLMSSAVRAGGPYGSVSPFTASGVDHRTTAIDRPTAEVSSAPGSGGTELSVAAPATAATADAATSRQPVLSTTGVLLRVQPVSSLRALTRLGPDGRLLAGVLAGLLLAIIGRCTPARRRPVLVLLPASAAPGLGLRRRGPPLR